jgi:integrase
MRIGELLALRWDDTSLTGHGVLTRADDNKAGRDERLPLHPNVVEHLTVFPPKGKLLFPWPYNETTLYEEFRRIQTAAGNHLACHEDHEHTDTCHFYGFHDLRRAFASQNASRVTAPVLQKLMRHKSFATTLGYINLASQLQSETEKLARPKLKPDTPREDSQAGGSGSV